MFYASNGSRYVIFSRFGDQAWWPSFGLACRRKNSSGAGVLWTSSHPTRPPGPICGKGSPLLDLANKPCSSHNIFGRYPCVFVCSPTLQLPSDRPPFSPSCAHGNYTPAPDTPVFLLSISRRFCAISCLYLLAPMHSHIPRSPSPCRRSTPTPVNMSFCLGESVPVSSALATSET